MLRNVQAHLINVEQNDNHEMVCTLISTEEFLVQSDKVLTLYQLNKLANSVDGSLSSFIDI